MSETRHKNVQWNLGTTYPNANWEQAKAALLMDIRDELQTLNQLLACPNFIAIPRKLDEIARNTKRTPRVKKKP